MVSNALYHTDLYGKIVMAPSRVSTSSLALQHELGHFAKPRVTFILSLAVKSDRFRPSVAPRQAMGYWRVPYDDSGFKRPTGHCPRTFLGDVDAQSPSLRGG